MKNGIKLFKDFDTLNNVFERYWFNDPFFNNLSNVFEKNRFLDYPDVKIEKDENEYRLLVVVPGLTKDDLKITIKDGDLVISYEKEEKKKNSYFINSFSKFYILPDDVSQDKIVANVKDGVLEIKLPFYEKKPLEKVIEIE